MISHALDRTNQILGVDGIGSAACTAALQVQEPAARDREGPGTERLLISSEAIEAPRDVQPRIGRDVVRVARRDRARVPDEPRVDGAIQLGQGPSFALTRRREHFVEPTHGGDAEATRNG